MSTEQAQSTTGENKNFATLASDDEYARYFNELCFVFQRLVGCYRVDSNEKSYESALIVQYLRRLLHVVEVLRIKYTYRAGESRSLWVDLTESGFPNSAELRGLEVDLARRQDRLMEMPIRAILKRNLLDHLFKYQKDSSGMLAQLSERTYLEMLDRHKLFLPFTPGDLRLLGSDKKSGQRSYVFSWACYDFETNRPYLHLMTFEQNIDREPLDLMEDTWKEFIGVMEREGSRAPNVGILALAIDDAIEYIHPKILKRICIGPLYSRLLLEGRDANEADAKEMGIRSILQNAPRGKHDFVLFFTDEIVFSQRQEVTRSMLSPLGKVREIFAIHEQDPECYKRRASVVSQQVLLPHGLLQHLERAHQLSIPDFDSAKKLTFDETGVVHGI